MPRKGDRQHITPDEAFSDMPIINEFAEAAMVDETPPDIDEFLSEIGLVGKAYHCTIKQYPPEQSGAPVFMPGSWNGSYPTIPELGSKYGPGKYQYFFSWRVPNPNGQGTTSKSKVTEVILSEAWEDAHDEYMFQYNIRRKKKLENLALRQEQKKILNGSSNSKSEKTGVEDLLEASNKLRQLGVPVGQSTALTNSGDNGFLPLIVSMQQENTKMMMQTMQASQSQMMTLVGLMFQNNNGQNNFQEAMKQTMNMVMGVVDLKQALNPEKEGLVDKIFSFMQGIAPEITRIISQPRNEAKQDPMVKLAQTRPEMEALKGDQAAIDALAQRLDSEYGIRQANEILDVMGLSRSEALKQHLKTGGYDVNPHPPQAAQNIAQDAEIQESSTIPEAVIPDEPDEEDLI